MAKYKYSNHLNLYLLAMRHLFKLIITAVLLCVSYLVQAQDTITKTDNTTLKVRIVSVGPNLISYRLWSNQNGTLYRIRKADVLSIKYQDGKEEIFGSEKKEDVKKEDVQTTPETPVATTPPPSPSAKNTSPSATPPAVKSTTQADKGLMYEKAVKQRKTGKTLSILGGITLAAGAAVTTVGLLNANKTTDIMYYDADNPDIIYGFGTATGNTGKLTPMVIGGSIAMALGATFLCIGIPVSASGNKKIKEYNRQNGYGAVLNVSPAPYGVSLALRF